MGLLSLWISLLTAQDKPVVKVDFNEASRKEAEVLEPGYTAWAVGKANTLSTLTVEGVTFTLTSEGVRSSWSKALVQAATDNSRFTMDGLTMEGDKSPGEYTLSIKGLPAGSHTLQTFHNDWADPTQYCGLPIHIFLNGEEKAVLSRTWQKTAIGDVASSMIVFTVASETDEAVFRFYTNADDDFDNETGTQTKLSGSPLMNGFELNTVQSTAKSKKPDPADGDMHVDADAGDYLLSWSSAGAQVAKHHVYLGTDYAAVASATTATVGVYQGAKSAGDTTYAVTDLYSMNTYYWRIDEEDNNGVVTPGDVWSFRPRHLAFPGAEGYGRYATGGRGGVVYHVTNLKNDHNPGSFLYGLVDMEGPRTIVFDVSGLIVMDFESYFAKPYVTIAAQTAPGKGICLKASNLGIGSESICRFLRARRGYGPTGNAMGVGSDHTIVDHSTAAWGTDETFSSRNAKNITFQYSMIAEALGIADHKNYAEGTNHGYAATIGGSIGTFSHNLLVDCYGRNWSMGGGLDGAGKAAGELDMVNNVCYNWGRRTTDGGAKWMQFVNNYYKMGPDTRLTILFSADNELGGHRAQFAYVKGNVRINRDGSVTQDRLDETYRATGDYPEETWVSEPFFPSYITLHSAMDAYKVVTSDAGATMPCRDDHHLRMVRETLEGSYTYVGSRSGIKGEIDHEDDAGGFEVFPEEARPADWDADQDGMPTWWEKVTGSDPAVADNNADPDRDGYTLLEDYLEFMAHPYVVLHPGADTLVDVRPWFRGFQKSPVYTVKSDSPLFETSIENGQVTVRAGSVTGVAPITVTVTDAEGSTFSQRLSVAIASQLPTAVEQPAVDFANMEAVSREFFTLDGKKARTLQSQETYIMKVTDTAGRVHAVKVIMD